MTIGIKSLFVLGAFVLAIVVDGRSAVAHPQLGPDHVPPGSYQQTCTAISFSGGTLSATCLTADQQPQRTSLGELWSCTGDITNANGQLLCNRGRIPDGSYQQSCTRAEMRGHTLFASCRTSGGNWVDTSLAAIPDCVGDIGNNDGSLTCPSSAVAPEGVVMAAPVSAAPPAAVDLFPANGASAADLMRTGHRLQIAGGVTLGAGGVLLVTSLALLIADGTSTPRTACATLDCQASHGLSPSLVGGLVTGIGSLPLLAGGLTMAIIGTGKIHTAERMSLQGLAFAPTFGSSGVDGGTMRATFRF